MKDLKVVFMGTPQFSVQVLENLIKETNVIGVVTQPDKKVGRKQEIKFSPVKSTALKHDINVIQPFRIKSEYQEILDLNPDIIITCAYGQIIPTELLEAPRLGCINVHASLLPKLRGGAPIHKSIIYGYEETGITIMYMAERMDAGDIISQASVKIEDDDTAATLHDSLSQIGAELLMDTLPNIIDGDIEAIKQVESEVTYAWNITREEEHIDFGKTSREIFNQIRGLNSFPGAFVILNNEVIKVWASYVGSLNKKAENGEIINIYKSGIGVKTLNGEIVITEIQPSGKKRMPVLNYLNGLQDKNELLGKIFK